MARMNPEVKARWVAALRSGEYKQGRGVLKSKEGFCCLGVLCDIHAKATGAKWSKKNHYMDHDTVTPDEVDRWAGLVYQEIRIGQRPDGFAEHNDAGRTFAEIADAIEAQL